MALGTSGRELVRDSRPIVKRILCMGKVSCFCPQNLQLGLLRGGGFLSEILEVPVDRPWCDCVSDNFLILISDHPRA